MVSNALPSSAQAQSRAQDAPRIRAQEKRDGLIKGNSRNNENAFRNHGHTETIPFGMAN